LASGEEEGGGDGGREQGVGESPGAENCGARAKGVGHVKIL
jgi:hypothetical protein